jgi:hypothetical protein
MPNIPRRGPSGNPIASSTADSAQIAQKIIITHVTMPVHPTTKFKKKRRLSTTE